MGNPTITRLGKTQFWYKNWYTDKKYSFFLKKINTFEALIKIYFNYGLFFYHNFFYHKFWYKKPPMFNYQTRTNNYFRKHFYSHQTLTIEHSYFIRLKTSEYFPLRLYLLKYNNWLIATVQWFKPFKQSSLDRKRSSTSSSPRHTLVSQTERRTIQFLRLKVIISLLKSNPSGQSFNYKYFF